MEMGANYDTEAEALLDHHRALIAIKRDIKEANKIGWEALLSEVIYGLRATRYDYKKDKKLSPPHNEMIDTLFDAMFGLHDFDEVMQSYYQNVHPINSNEKDFPEQWQSKWA